MLSSTSAPARSRTSNGRHPHIQRYMGTPNAVADPNQMFDWYASAWSDDPLWTNPGDGQAVSVARNGGTLAESGAYLGVDGLVLPGVAGNYASVPDSAALDITGDITLVARVALDDWTPAANQVVVSKWTTSANQRSAFLQVDTNGRLRLYWSPDGSTGVTFDSSPSAVSFADGEVGWVAATLDVDNGASGHDVKFWTSTDGVTWAQLGNTRTGVGTTSVYSSTTPVDFGTINGGAGSPLDGTLSVAHIYSGSGFSAAGPSGTLVLDVDFRVSGNPTTFVCDTGQTVTRYSTFDFVQGTAGSRPTFDASLSTFNGFSAVDHDGTDDKLAILTDVSIAQPFSAVFMGVADSLSQQNLLGLNDGATGRGLRISATGAILYVSAAGSVTSAAGVITAGVPFIAVCYVTGTSVVISVNKVTVASGALVGDDVNQIVVGSGRNWGGAFANPFDGKWNFTSLIAGFPFFDYDSQTLFDFAHSRGCSIA